MGRIGVDLRYFPPLIHSIVAEIGLGVMSDGLHSSKVEVHSG